MALWHSINKLLLGLTLPFFRHPVSLGAMISLNGLNFFMPLHPNSLETLIPKSCKGALDGPMCRPYPSIPVLQQTCYSQQTPVRSHWKLSFLISKLSQKRHPQGRPRSSKSSVVCINSVCKTEVVLQMEQLLFFFSLIQGITQAG